MRIGVFDSGIGGEAIAANLRMAFSDAEVVRVSDRNHLPYGNRQPAEIFRLTNKAIQPLLNEGCDVIVIACNTATTSALPQLRLDYPDQLFIGIEPMIRPTRKLTRTKTVAVFATPATLASASYRRLKLLYGAGLTFIEPDCSDWAELIETNTMNRSKIDTVTLRCLDEGADVIVLGCTHYLWIHDEIEQVASDKAIVLEPSIAIANRVRQLLDR
jgi:glutamate racemase